jgi:hypothetical protein
MRNDVIAAATLPASTETAPEITPPRNAIRWWQWVLLYPTLAGTLFSAAPTWVNAIQSLQHGVAREDLAFAQEQNRLFEQNTECLKSEIQPIRNNRNVEVGAQVCPTGDVLIRIKPPDGGQKLRWVSVRSLEAFGGFGPARAFAAPPVTVSQASQTVLEQRWLRPGFLKQRVREANACFDLVINTYTGSVVGRTAVACNAAFS